MKLSKFKWLLVLPVILFANCGPEPTAPLTKQEEVTQLLTGSGTSSKTWHLQSVSIDGVDKSSLFTGMTLSFTSSSFTVSNGGPVWPATGTWTFTSDAATTIRRNDGLEMTVDATSSSLKLTLTWSKNTFGPGRQLSVSGQHVFTFN
jgi:hypothetical protein